MLPPSYTENQVTFHFWNQLFEMGLYTCIIIFQTEILKNEFERVQNRLPMELLSMKRYELPAPPSGKMTDIAAWNECVDNSHAQLEHQALR